ncbi:MAG TPA: hypothetical protein PKL98_02075 [Candidatus Pacearchaeota archaeon]|nr:hypothetical protein [Candidatus Pacearchaeota archaeon]HPM08454.1 hypothetical protein [Candidatus Pacearchaeota archaeon]
MYNPEKSLIEKERGDSVENVDYILENQISERIDESDFSDIYGKESIAKDKDYVQKMKRNFREAEDQLTSQEREKVHERKRKSEALEIIISEQGTKSGWFANENIKSSIIRTSEYDDIKNGVDSIVEFEIYDNDTKSIRRVALAIDASMSADSSVLDRKIKRNMERFQHLQDLGVKYFESEVEDYKGELNGVMPVVFALDGRNTNELINLTAQNKKLIESRESAELLKETKRELDGHPCQQIFLREARLQFEAYLRKLEQIKSPRSEEMIQKVRQDLEVINILIDSKREIPLGNFMNDQAFSRMENLIAPKEKFDFST